VTHATATALFSKMGGVSKVGASLGSFSISTPLLLALLGEFAGELDARGAKFDSDPHFWMPMTLDLDSYQSIMAGKGVSQSEAAAHFDRMQAFKNRFLAQHPAQGLFGAVDVGGGCYWWDYGQLPLYLKNVLLLTADGEEADAMRAFLGVGTGGAGGHVGEGVKIEKGGVVIGCDISSGHVRGGVLVNVKAKDVDVDNSVVISTVAKKISAHNGYI
jgi:hypothetical protein